MVSTLLRTIAILASLVLLTSFSLFAIDQAGGASNQAQSEVDGGGNQALGPAIHGAGAKTGVRRTIDSAAGDLVSPFALAGTRKQPTRGDRTASTWRSDW